MVLSYNEMLYIQHKFTSMAAKYNRVINSENAERKIFSV